MSRAATSRLRALLLLLVMGTVAGACPGVPRPAERPHVTVEQVAVTSVQRRYYGVAILLHISNPNRHDVTLEAVDWELTLGSAASMRDTPSIRGRTLVQRLLPARDASVVELPLRIPPGSAARPTASDYHLRATLHFGDIFATIDESGVLSPDPRAASAGHIF